MQQLWGATCWQGAWHSVYTFLDVYVYAKHNTNSFSGVAAVDDAAHGPRPWWQDCGAITCARQLALTFMTGRRHPARVIYVLSYAEHDCMQKMGKGKVGGGVGWAMCVMM